METVQITEEDIRTMIDEAFRELWRRSGREPMEIGGRMAGKLDITDFVRKDKEMCSVLWRSGLSTERISFKGHVLMKGNKISDIRILDYDLEFTGDGSDEWLEGTREIRNWFDDIMQSPYILERWDILEMIRDYIHKVYKR